MHDLETAIGLVEKTQAGWNQATRRPFDSTRYTEWRAAYNAGSEVAKSALLAAGATIREDFVGGVALRLAGIRSVSTSGIGGAMSNWLIRARAKLAESTEARRG